MPKTDCPFVLIDDKVQLVARVRWSSSVWQEVARKAVVASVVECLLLETMTDIARTIPTSGDSMIDCKKQTQKIRTQTMRIVASHEFQGKV